MASRGFQEFISVNLGSYFVGEPVQEFANKYEKRIWNSHNYWRGLKYEYSGKYHCSVHVGKNEAYVVFHKHKINGRRYRAVVYRLLPL